MAKRSAARRFYAQLNERVHDSIGLRSDLCSGYVGFYRVEVIWCGFWEPNVRRRVGLHRLGGQSGAPQRFMHPNMIANTCVVHRIRLFIVHAKSKCFSHNRAGLNWIWDDWFWSCAETRVRAFLQWMKWCFELDALKEVKALHLVLFIV